MSYKNIETWVPQNKTAHILNLAKQHIESVDYKVSARWVFYRLLQDGIYNQKVDYDNFLGLTSRARHSGLWHPAILADETRDMLSFPTWGEDPAIDEKGLIDKAVEDAIQEKEDLEEQLANYEYRHNIDIDPFCYQDYVTTIMFEARAMLQQFQKYTHGIDLCPFGGQPSIPFKYQIAKHLERMYDQYRKPLVVLYFGDLDDAGLAIFETGEKDIQKWCAYPVEFIRCGLTEEQVEKYAAPENVEHPGYQWEALTDNQAREIIGMAIKPFWNDDAEKMAKRRKAEIEHYVNLLVAERLSE